MFYKKKWPFLRHSLLDMSGFADSSGIYLSKVLLVEWRVTVKTTASYSSHLAQIGRDFFSYRGADSYLFWMCINKNSIQIRDVSVKRRDFVWNSSDYALHSCVHQVYPKDHVTLTRDGIASKGTWAVYLQDICVKPKDLFWWWKIIIYGTIVSVA